jgi:uncharacterized membrane protein (DUF2068 family)
MRPKLDQSGDRGVLAIGILKLIKAALLCAAALGGLALLDSHIRDAAAQWIDVLQGDSKSRYVQALLTRTIFVDHETLAKVSAGTFFYAGLSLTEGIGLLRRRRWAHYLTVIATASLIPIEIVELTKEISPFRLIVTGINIVVVLYLVYRLCEGRSSRKPAVAEELKNDAAASRRSVG